MIAREYVPMIQTLLLKTKGTILKRRSRWTIWDQEPVVRVAREWRLNAGKPWQFFSRPSRATDALGPQSNWLLRFRPPFDHAWLALVARGGTDRDTPMAVVIAWWERERKGEKERERGQKMMRWLGGLWATWQALSGHFRTFYNRKSFP